MATMEKYDFGMIGLGTMGRNLLLNMSDHGVKGAGYDRDSTKIPLLEEEARNGITKGFDNIHDFIASLKTPRAIMMLVPAGKIVDEVIDELIPLLDKGDILIDGGNSHFTDTDKRDRYLSEKGLHFFGMGISGGEDGARHGPSMMPGGDKAAYDIMKPVLESIAARVDDEPCVTYIGPGASGHFVKMVHNGIEYGLMQLIAETYGYLKHLLGLKNDEIAQVFNTWNQGRLKSFLLEITTEIFQFREKDASHILLDDIKDQASAKGTGKWTSQIAMDLEVPIPTIDTAVSMRDLSKLKSLRIQLSNIPGRIIPKQETNLKSQLHSLENAFYCAMITTYAQGMHLLFKASAAYKYDLDLGAIARIWRGGCIIRSSFLNDIYMAYKNNPGLEHLFTDKNIQESLQQTEAGLRTILIYAIQGGIGMPAYSASLSYYDSLDKATLSSNLIQAQRDYFGAHRYEKNGFEGNFHTDWQTGISDNNSK